MEAPSDKGKYLYTETITFTLVVLAHSEEEADDIGVSYIGTLLGYAERNKLNAKFGVTNDTLLSKEIKVTKLL